MYYDVNKVQQSERQQRKRLEQIKARRVTLFIIYNEVKRETEEKEVAGANKIACRSVMVI